MLSFARLAFVDMLDYKFYDLMMGMRGDAEPSNDIALVEIDDDSIEKLGRWPWPRSLIADGILKINAGGPKLIGVNLILSEPTKNPALQILEELEGLFATEVLNESGQKGRMFLEVISESRKALDEDRILAEAFRQTSNVVLPVFFKESAVEAEASVAADQALIDQSVQNIRDPLGFSAACYRASDIILPIPEFFEAAKGIGHINIGYDMDGTLRRERLLYNFGGLYIPSYTLKLATLYLNLSGSKVRADLGESMHVGSLKIPTTVRTEQLVSFKGPGGAFKRYSFFDVVNEKVPASLFKNKLVIIGPSAAGLMNPLPTPVDNQMPLGDFSANTIWAILNQQFIQQPAWGGLAELLLIVLIGRRHNVCHAAAEGQNRRRHFRRLDGVAHRRYHLSFCCRRAMAADGVSAAAPHLRLYRGGQHQLFSHGNKQGKQSRGNLRSPTGSWALPYQAQGMLDMVFRQVSAGSHGQGTQRRNLQPRPRFRAQAAVQQGCIGLRVHRGTRPQVQRCTGPQEKADAGQRNHDVRRRLSGRGLRRRYPDGHRHGYAANAGTV